MVVITFFFIFSIFSVSFSHGRINDIFTAFQYDGNVVYVWKGDNKYELSPIVVIDKDFVRQGGDTGNINLKFELVTSDMKVAALNHLRRVTRKCLPINNIGIKKSKKVKISMKAVFSILHDGLTLEKTWLMDGFDADVTNIVLVLPCTSVGRCSLYLNELEHSDLKFTFDLDGTMYTVTPYKMPANASDIKEEPCIDNRLLSITKDLKEIKEKLLNQKLDFDKLEVDINKGISTIQSQINSTCSAKVKGCKKPEELTSCSSFLDMGMSHGTGFYTIQNKCLGKPVSIYCDQTTDGGGWLRLHYKTGANSCDRMSLTPMDENIVSCLLKDTSTPFTFAVSSSPTTLNTGDGTWILRNATFGKPYHCPVYNCRDGNYIYFEKWRTITNVVNCKTPSGTAWNLGYKGGYMTISGVFDTFGTWKKMFGSCLVNNSWTYIDVGSKVTLKIGGHPHHTGEFIHSHCNGYHPGRDHSITSRWDTANTRTFWIRINV